MANYDPLAKYWIVYQYGPGQCPHVFTTDDHGEATVAYEEIPAQILAFNLSGQR
jgi:hypothetical protein